MKMTVKNTQLINAVIIIGIIVLSLLRSMQGLDFTDQGFSLTNYKYFFSGPEYVTDSMGMYFTNLIGGLFHAVFGFMGMWGFRLLKIVFDLGTIVMIFVLFKDRYFVTLKLLLGFLALVYINRYSVDWFHYNHATAFFSALLILFLWKGYDEERNWVWHVFTGVIYTAFIFSRLPNVIAIIYFLITAISYHSIKKVSRNSLFKIILFWVIGALSAVILMFVLMTIFGQFNAFIQGLEWLGGQATGAKYSLIGVFKNIVVHNIDILAKGVVLCVVAGLVFIIIPKLKALWSRLIIVAAGIILFCIYGFGLIFFNYYYFKEIAGVIYVSLFYLFYYKISIEKDSRDIVLILLLIASLVVVQFGSNNGIKNSVYAMWIPLMYIGGEFWRLIGNSGSEKLTRIVRGGFVIAMWAVLLVHSLGITARYVYRDGTNRFNLTARVTHPLTWNIWTTPERAEAVLELLEYLPTIENNYEHVITMASTPLLHYFSDLKPSFSRAWVDLLPFEQIETELTQIEVKSENTRVYPVIILPHFSLRKTDWPNVPMNYIHSDLEDRMELIFDFIERNGYSIIWSGIAFTVYSKQ